MLTQAAPVPITSMHARGLEKPAQGIATSAVDASAAEATLHQRNEDQLQARTRGLETFVPDSAAALDSTLSSATSSSLAAIRSHTVPPEELAQLSSSPEVASIGRELKRKQTLRPSNMSLNGARGTAMKTYVNSRPPRYQKNGQ